MISNKLSVKVSAPAFQPADSTHVLESFHACIAECALPEILVDAADYRHMHDGPGIVLIGHESHYYFGEQRGQFGLSCSRKRGFAEGMHPLGDALTRALRACELLQQSFCSSPELFDTSTLDVSIADRRVTQLAAFRMGKFASWVQQYLARVYQCAPSVEVMTGAGLPTIQAHCSPRHVHDLRARALECMT